MCNLISIKIIIIIAQASDAKKRVFLLNLFWKDFFCLFVFCFFILFLFYDLLKI